MYIRFAFNAYVYCSLREIDNTINICGYCVENRKRVRSVFSYRFHPHLPDLSIDFILNCKTNDFRADFAQIDRFPELFRVEIDVRSYVCFLTAYYVLNLRQDVLDVRGQVRTGRGSERGVKHQDREKRDRVCRQWDGPEHGDGHQNIHARRERIIDIRKVPAHGTAKSEYIITIKLYLIDAIYVSAFFFRTVNACRVLQRMCKTTAAPHGLVCEKYIRNKYISKKTCKVKVRKPNIQFSNPLE